MSQKPALLAPRPAATPWGWLVQELPKGRPEVLPKDRGAVAPVDRPVPASLTLTAKKLRA